MCDMFLDPGVSGVESESVNPKPSVPAVGLEKISPRKGRGGRAKKKL